MKKYYLVILLFLLMPIAHATGYSQSNQYENTTLWSDITENGLFYDAQYANITVIDHSKTKIINNASMTKYGKGIFYLNTTFNVTGDYYAYTTYYNGNTEVAVSSETHTVKTPLNNMEIAIIIGLIALIAYSIFTAKDLMNKPVDKTSGEIGKALNAKNIGVFFLLLTSWLIVALTGFMTIATMSTAYNTLMTALFIATVILAVGFNILYLSLYLMYRSAQVVEQVNTRRNK